MKKKLTITGIFNDYFTNYEDKESSVSMIVDMEEDCRCTPCRTCWLHTETEGHTFTDINDSDTDIDL